MKLKDLAKEVKEHVQVDFHFGAYFVIYAFAVILLIINYYFNFERNIIHPFYGKLSGITVYVLYYLIPYFIGIILFLTIKKQTNKLRSSELWMKSFLFVTIIGTFSALSLHADVAAYFVENKLERKYLTLLFSNLKKVIPYIITLYFVYLIYDKSERNFYGFAKTNLSYRPFFFMLLLVLPLVIAASFLPDFRAYYPRFKYWENTSLFGLDKLEMNLVFLFCYAMDFISVELMFRGALVIGMVKLLGREAILPMALVYMIFHFGKPIGETISSFFGGYILGILSYNHQNIKGGIVVHIGLALMMEIAAILQHIRTS